MAQIKLDSNSNYFLHKLGQKGGALSLDYLKKDGVPHGIKAGETHKLIAAMRNSGLLTVNGCVGEEQINLTEKGRNLYLNKRE